MNLSHTFSILYYVIYSKIFKEIGVYLWIQMKILLDLNRS